MRDDAADRGDVRIERLEEMVATLRTSLLNADATIRALADAVSRLESRIQRRRLGGNP